MNNWYLNSNDLLNFNYSLYLHYFLNKNWLLNLHNSIYIHFFDDFHYLLISFRYYFFDFYESLDRNNDWNIFFNHSLYINFNRNLNKFCLFYVNFYWFLNNLFHLFFHNDFSGYFNKLY